MVLWSKNEIVTITTEIINLLYKHNCADVSDVETITALVRNHFKKLTYDDIENFEATGKTPNFNIKNDIDEIIHNTANDIVKELMCKCKK